MTLTDNVGEIGLGDCLLLLNLSNRRSQLSSDAQYL